MNHSDTEEPRDERDDTPMPNPDAPRAPRSSSRDLDAIAARLAAARQAAAFDDQPSAPGDGAAAAANDGVAASRVTADTTPAAKPDARDAARIRSLIDRSPKDDFSPDARGYASTLGSTGIDGVDRATPQPAGADTREAPSTGHGVEDPGQAREPFSSHVADAPAPMRFPRQDEIDDLARPVPAARPRRLARGLAVGMTATAGLIIALGAYAGGGEIISDLIDGDTQPRALAPAPIVELPPVIIDSALSAADSIAEAEQLASFGELPNDTIRRAPFGSGRMVILPAARRPKIGDTLRPQIERAAADSKSGERNIPGSGQAAKPAASATTPAKPPVSDGAGAGRTASTEPVSRQESFRVQVRATPDRTEADRLAGRLRSRGAKNVTVTESTKNGARVYRVRYGSFASEGEARDAARRDGHNDAWVVRR